MLVLSRKLGEQIVIGDSICVTVVAVHGNRVRLGFSAPVEVSIRREELGRRPAKRTKKREQTDICAGVTVRETRTCTA